MNSIDILGKNWIDLVFDGRNKAYGAYALRRQSAKTTMLAFLMGLSIITSLVAIPVLIQKIIGDSPAPAIPELQNIRVTLSDYKPEPPRMTMPQSTQPPAITSAQPPVQLVDPVVTQAEQAVQNIATNQQNQPSPLTEPGDGTAVGSPDLTAAVGPTAPAAAPSTPAGPVASALLDKLPEFPGGVDKFREYVGRNFRAPAAQVATTIRIQVMFVIEKDGTISRIQVRTPNPELEREAIRVLQSLKKKWKPGLLNGEPVATTFTMPIVLKIE